MEICRSGGIGRHAGLRGLWILSVWVQVPSSAPLMNLFELFELIYMNQSEMIDFFVIKKIIERICLW